MATNRSRRRPVKRRTSRDAEDPVAGEVYQSRTTGNIWEVTAFNRDRRRVSVKRTGNARTSDLVWNPVVLRGMKQLQSKVAAEVRQVEGPPGPPPTASGLRGWFGSIATAPDMDGKDRRYYVYVIQSIRKGKRVLYVGQSAHTPAQRLLQHKQGAIYCDGCTGRSYAKGARMKLVPEFYKKIPPLRTRARAEKIERMIARKLRSYGFNVEGGH